MRALVVGGTGPTGPYIVNGLLERGYQVAIFHRGTHEIPEIPPQVEHIHGDPHFLETIEDSLAGRTFDIAVATYGRVRFLAEALVGKVGRFISVGGVASYRGYMNPEILSPTGLPVPVTEQMPVVTSEKEHRFSHLIAQTEQIVLDYHANAAHFRYPYVYGPRQLVPREWSIIRRALDKRSRIVLADAGLSLSTHGYVANLAHAVLLAVDKPKASSGEIYNCGDDTQFTLSQVVEAIATKMNHQFEIISMPYDLALPARPYITGPSTHHRVMDTSKIKNQLGYRDINPVVEALGLTVDWLLENRPDPGGELEERLQDPFNYDGEDRLIDAWHSSIERVREIPFAVANHRPHPYAHPRKPGERDHRNR
jgi:nucleoside-diphosphate-sugar epimerase